VVAVGTANVQQRQLALAGAKFNILPAPEVETFVCNQPLPAVFECAVVRGMLET
jgi:hypothetical protein